MSNLISQTDYAGLKAKISEIKNTTSKQVRMLEMPVSYDERWGKYTMKIADVKALDSMYGINPRTQRKYLFKDVKNNYGTEWQRNLFLSILLGNPIPQFELSANLTSDKKLKFLIQDGQQRIRTIGAIVANCIATPKSIEDYGPEFFGYGNKNFDDLSIELQERFLNFSIEFLIAFGLTNVEEYNRFLLINNGTPLSKQDKRSAQVSNGAAYIQALVDGEPNIEWGGIFAPHLNQTSPKYRMFDITATAKNTEHTFLKVSTSGRSVEEIVAHWFNTTFHNKIQTISQDSLDKLYGKFEGNVNIPSTQLKSRFEKYLKTLSDSVIHYDKRKMMEGRVVLFSFFVLREFMDKNEKINPKTFMRDYIHAVSILKKENKAWNPRGDVDDPNTDQKYTRLFSELFRTGSFDYQIERVTSEIYNTMRQIMSDSNKLVTQDSTRKFSKEDKIIRYSEQGGCCGYCGTEISLEEGVCDHKHPWSDGGRTTLDNLVVSCQDCNNLKGSLPSDAWDTLLNMGLLKNLKSTTSVTE